MSDRIEELEEKIEELEERIKDLEDEKRDLESKLDSARGLLETFVRDTERFFNYELRG